VPFVAWSSLFLPPSTPLREDQGPARLRG